MAGEQLRRLGPLQALTPAEEKELLEQILERRRRKRKVPGPLKINMTPMIDVVFLLIIFFMVVTELQKMEVEAVTLPYALKAEDDKESGTRLVVNVTKTDPRTGRTKIIVMRRIVTFEQLKAILQAKADAAPRDDANLPVLAVKIRADANCEYKFVQQVMVQCMRAYIWRVSFGASPVDREEKMLFGAY